MSLTFKFDGNNKSNPQKAVEEITEEKNIELYDQPGNARNIYFISKDGTHRFFNYAYLEDCKFLPEEKTIELSFTTHTVTLKGHNLEDLMMDLFYSRPKIITCIVDRYAATKNQTETFVMEIIVKIKEGI